MTGPSGPHADQTWPKLTKAQMQAIAPLKADGVGPDLYNNLPTRMIPQQEAQFRGWNHFYVGDVCAHGHKAPRYVLNPTHCVDCHRIRNGRLPIGGRGEKERPLRTHNYPATRAARGTAVATVAAPLEPDPTEKKFLKAYAELRDFEAAAKEIQRPVSEFLARLSYSNVFRDAVGRLEADNGLSRTASLTEDFEWTDDKRVVLYRVYINTGNLDEAIAAIGCSNWAFERELQENPNFCESMMEAEATANKKIERVGISRAMQGDSRLLQMIMAAKLPDYNPRMKLDVNLTEKLTDDQIAHRFLLALQQLNIGVITSRPSIDAEFSEPEPAGALEAPSAGGEAGTDDPEEPDSDLL